MISKLNNIEFDLLESIYLSNQYQLKIYYPAESQLKAWYNNNSHFPFPYWGKTWESAIALSQFISNHNIYFKHKTVFEIGSGLGLAGITAAVYSKQVILSDVSEHVLPILQHNINQNNLVNTTTQLFDIDCHKVVLNTDVLLVSDVNYHHNLNESLIHIFKHQLESQGAILLATPARIQAKHICQFFSPYLKHTQVLQINNTDIHIYLFTQDDVRIDELK